jgi:hypothetical protein
MEMLASEDPTEIDISSTAECIRADFEVLIRIFDVQLADHPRADAETRAHIAEARLAAERGLALSQQLARMIQKRTE